jgi:hypothetical protein
VQVNQGLGRQPDHSYAGYSQSGIGREFPWRRCELAADLRLQMRRQGAAIARLHVFPPRPAVTAQRLVIEDPLGEEQPLLDSFTQRKTVTVNLNTPRGN